MPSIDYAKAYGIESLAAAIVFTILYVPLLAFFIVQAIQKRTRVYFVLSLFCLMRITAFALRSALAGSTAAASSENVLIAFEVIYNIGFFGVLYSAYTLVLERESLVDMDTLLMYCPGPLQLVFRLTRRRALIRIALLVAVAIGIAGITDITNATSAADLNQGTALRSASMYIFLAVASLLVVQALALSFATMRTLAKQTHASQQQQPYAASTGTLSMFVLLAIAALLQVREAFYGATVHNTAQQTNEYLWYPLSAVTEFVAIVLFTIPGLVPAQDELPRGEHELGLLA